jgi:hypothetical protein
MADFVPLYVPVTGDVLTSAGFNRNMYSTTATESIHETGNGHLEYLNFDPAFQVRGYQVRPGQTGQTISVGRTPSVDYFSDLWTGDGVGYIPIAGCAVTFYSEYNCEMAMFFASAHCTMWRQFGADNGAWPSRATAPDISVRTFFASPNGQITTHLHSQRDMPQTVFIDPASAAAPNIAKISTVEQRLTRHYNLSHPKFGGGASPCDPILAGEHTFGLAILVKKNLSGQDTTNLDEAWSLRLNGAATADARPDTNYAAVPRVRFYARGCSAIRIL